MIDEHSVKVEQLLAEEREKFKFRHSNFMNLASQSVVRAKKEEEKVTQSEVDRKRK